MEIGSIANKIACSGVTGANTGKLGCLSLFGTPTHFLALDRGTIIPSTTEFNVAWLTPEIQKGKITPILDASAFEDMSAEDGYSTNTSGIKRLNLKGLPEYKLMFEEGHEFYREIAKLESFKSYAFVIGDDMGNWMLVKKTSGDFAGFTAGHITPTLTKRKVRGGDAESKSLVVQFLDRLEWDVQYSILHVEEIGFYPSDIPTVNGANLSFAAIPAAAETTVTVNAKLSADNNTPIEGLVLADFSWKVDGVVTAITGVTESAPGVYVLTVPAIVAAKKYTVDMWDDTLKVHIILNGGILYRADEETVTAVA